MSSAPRILDTVNLDNAMLCLDCDAIFDLSAGACPDCGSRAFMAIANKINRKPGTYRLNDFAADVHMLAIRKGLYDRKSIHDLMQHLEEEVWEAKKAFAFGDSSGRTNRLTTRVDSSGKPEGFAVEMADVLIMAASICRHFGIDVDEAVRVKHEYNRRRPR